MRIVLTDLLVQDVDMHEQKKGGNESALKSNFYKNSVFIMISISENHIQCITGILKYTGFLFFSVHSSRYYLYDDKLLLQYF